MKSSFRLKARDYLDSGEKKAHFNRLHFAESAPRYDLATRLLSMGRDASWKRALVAMLPESGSLRCADIACGTGDISLLLAERYPGGECLGFDLTEEMLEIARKRADARGFGTDRIDFACSDMGLLALEDDSVDLLTGAYAIRNAPDLESTLHEIHRVVRPGGHVAFLDFRKPDGRVAQGIQYAMLRFWGGLWGLVLHGNPEVHGYIAASLRSFPGESDLIELYGKSGLEVREIRTLFGGTMALHHLRIPESSGQLER